MTLSESLQPLSYSVTISFTFDTLIPCNGVADVKQVFQDDVISNLRCKLENDSCSATFDITDCSVQRRKRAVDGSSAEIVLEIPLLSNATFDLVEYYATTKSM